MTQTREQLPEWICKEIFHALVVAQDKNISVTESRRQMTERFGVNENLVRQIEREGIEHEWPPL